MKTAHLQNVSPALKKSKLQCDFIKLWPPLCMPKNQCTEKRYRTIGALMKIISPAAAPVLPFY